ncbi:unnamed protein product [Wuchereria bancrofti]|uniref:Uncharacterized protein n=1 Tax=Wuchereria bancrofti TaxID=6293 RepID=A0A3P7E1Y0_WUCBA|nr:unnamed protein product [Wuchereria bancrofti]
MKVNKMEIEKPVLQQSSTDLLKCYHDVSFNSSLSHHPDISKAEVVKKIDYMTGNDNSDSDNSSSRAYLLLDEAKEDEENDNDNESKSSNTIFKQHFANFDVASKEEEEAATTTTTVANLNYPELSSFQHHFSMVPVEITKRNHAFVACKLVQNSSDSSSTINSNSINSIQEEIPEVEEKNSQNLQEKIKHSVSSLYSSSVVRQQNRRSVTLNNYILSLSINHDKNDNNFGTQDRTLIEKRPRIERPRARYPNSARRTSAPACLWPAPSLFPDQQAKSASSSLHDNLILLQKLLAKQRIMQENVATFNFDPSTSISNANDNIATASQSKISPPTLAPNFSTAQTSAPASTSSSSSSVLATWQLLRGLVFLSFHFFFFFFFDSFTFK